ncbi:MAG: hypothetical protein JWM86_1392, partial [Thermoleophilia bacterium]|nr:hypothetical protein [Thermoleophilia bacterium]
LVARRATWPTLGAANRAHVVERHSMRRWARDMADAYAELRPSRLDASAPTDAGRVPGRMEVAS